MIIDRDGNICIITHEKASLKTLVDSIEQVYDTYKSDHIIVSLTSLEEQITLEHIIEFLQLSNKHRTAQKSFVIVSHKVNLEEVPDEILIVPTIQEAYDIIEMEDIERDLGF